MSSGLRMLLLREQMRPFRSLSRLLHLNWVVLLALHSLIRTATSTRLRRLIGTILRNNNRFLLFYQHEAKPSARIMAECHRGTQKVQPCLQSILSLNMTHSGKFETTRTPIGEKLS